MEQAPYSPSTSFLDLLVDAVCAVDADGRFVFVSTACERIFGYTPEEMIGNSMIDMVAPEDRARTLAAAGDVMAGAAQPNFENRYLRKDGQLVHIMWSARWSEADQLRIAVARDVTERKRGEAMRAAMYAISEAAHAASDLLALFPLIHGIVNQLLPAPGFAIALPGDAPGQLSLPYNIDEHGKPAAHSVPAAGTLCAHVIESGRPLLITPATLAALPAGLRAAAGSAAPSWLGVPLTSHGGVIGALVVKSTPESARYTERDRELLQFVSDQVGTAIERVRLYEQWQYLARYDALTGLPNRQLFHDRLDSALARAVRNPGVFALLYLDLDKFKQVNDLHGHAAGDLLLHEVARRLGRCVREADTAARIGGDEFAVLLEGVLAPEDCARVAEKIFDALTLPVHVGHLTLHSIPSIGIAMYPQHGTSAQQLLKYADAAMYEVKYRRAETDRHCAADPIAG